MDYLKEIGVNAKNIEPRMRKLGSGEKNNILLAIADNLIEKEDYLLQENAKDIENGKKNNMS